MVLGPLILMTPLGVATGELYIFVTVATLIGVITSVLLRPINTTYFGYWSDWDGPRLTIVKIVERHGGTIPLDMISVTMQPISPHKCEFEAGIRKRPTVIL